MKSTTELKNTLDRLNLVSDSFCLAKWKNTTIHLHNGHTQSCHHVRSHPFEIDPKNPSKMHNTPGKLKSRKKMLNGQRPHECEYCWTVERKGELSDRVHKSSEAAYNDFFQEVLDSNLGANIHPSFLELSFDHTCQFRCMYCSPAYSSRWEKEVAEFGDYPTLGNWINKGYNRNRKALSKMKRDKNIQLFWQWWPELRNHLRYLRITGGEPLLSKETFRLIQDLIKTPQSNLRFAINSNLGFSDERMDKFIGHINQLQDVTKEVLVFTSIDSVGDQAEYIRFGLDEMIFYYNVEKILKKTKKPLTLCFMITVNLLSLPGFSSLLRKIQLLKNRFPEHRIHIDTPYLRQPEHLSVEILTLDFQEYLFDIDWWLKNESTFSESEIQKVSRIIPLVGNPYKNSAIKFLLRKDFLRFIREYDRRKGTSFENTFPEYKRFIELCSSDSQNFHDSFVDRYI